MDLMPFTPFEIARIGNWMLATAALLPVAFMIPNPTNLPRLLFAIVGVEILSSLAFAFFQPRY